MEFGDMVYVMERILGSFYIKANLPKIMQYYGKGSDRCKRETILEDMNALMTEGQQSDAWKYWESTQTIVEHIATGRI